MTQKIVIAGGTGFIGRHLTRLLQTHNYEIIVLTSKTLPENASDISYVHYEPGKEPEPEVLSAISGSYSVINLAGASIGKRWSSSYKNIMFESRINSTYTIVSAVNSSKEPPLSVINASAIGYYGARGSENLTEESSPGTDFLSRLSVGWEEEAKKLNNFITRLITPRFGVVLGADGGAFPELYGLAIKGRGASFGSGDNWMSWIHIDDLCEAILFLMDKTEHFGVFNIVSPNPVRKDELQNIIAEEIKKEVRLKAPRILIRLVGGEGAVNALFSSQYVLPQRLQDAGFGFRHDDIRKTVKELIEEMAKAIQN
jgi:uncharacterized protein (TIGR01777 family)